MPVIYVDNFRGFSKTFIPLKDVNFFVGENSTGKTSILKLIKILSEPRFWFTQEFSGGDTDLGYFSEIISKESSNNKSFTIGILGDKADKADRISAVIMRYVEAEGLPQIREINMIKSSFNVQAFISKNKLKYRINKIDLERVNEQNKLNYFKWWMENNPLKGNRYTYLDFSERDFPTESSLMFVQTMLDNYKGEKDLKEIVTTYSVPSFLKSIKWMAPIRAEPQRTYDSYDIKYTPEGNHAPYLLKKMLRNTRKKDTQRIISIIEKFGEESGLFDKIDVKTLGKGETAPFEIHVYLNNTPYKISNVGYGVSQILPILVSILSSDDHTWFSLQQPEIHLHPKAQAAFGEFIFKAAQNADKSFVVETHSDFIIDRYRFKVNKTTKEDFDAESQVIFFKRSDDGGNELTCIPIKRDGNYSENQPQDFRKFFIKEELNMIKI